MGHFLTFYTDFYESFSKLMGLGCMAPAFPITAAGYPRQLKLEFFYMPSLRQPESAHTEISLISFQSEVHLFMVWWQEDSKPRPSDHLSSEFPVTPWQAPYIIAFSMLELATFLVLARSAFFRFVLVIH